MPRAPFTPELGEPRAPRPLPAPPEADPAGHGLLRINHRERCRTFNYHLDTSPTVAGFRLPRSKPRAALESPSAMEGRLLDETPAPSGRALVERTLAEASSHSLGQSSKVKFTGLTQTLGQL